MAGPFEAKEELSTSLGGGGDPVDLCAGPLCLGRGLVASLMAFKRLQNT